MSTTTKDGGPAFPQGPWEDAEGNVETANPGMSLRDYFAAAALPALLTRFPPLPTTADPIFLQTFTGELFQKFQKQAVKAAYAAADAMLAAREAKQE